MTLAALFWSFCNLIIAQGNVEFSTNRDTVVKEGVKSTLGRFGELYFRR